jgi:hypothetical protein
MTQVSLNGRTVSGAVDVRTLSSGKENKLKSFDDLAMIQLRKNTRRTLQSVICLIVESLLLDRTPQDAGFVQNLIGRICLSADVVDSLFGSDPLDGIRSRLTMLTECLVLIFASPMQHIETEVTVDGQIPRALTETVLQITHELVAQALRCAPRNKSTGKIAISMVTSPNLRTLLTMTNSGAVHNQVLEQTWDFELIRALAAKVDGVVAIRNSVDLQVITISFANQYSAPVLRRDNGNHQNGDKIRMRHSLA